jgi:hypothetical protein
MKGKEIISDLFQTVTEGVWKLGVEENIWTKEGWSDGRVVKAA